MTDSPKRSSSSGEEASISDNSKRSSDDSKGEPSNQGCEEEPMPPASFYFRPDQYQKTCKISTRCTIVTVLEVLEKTLQKYEMEWFTDHQNQLRHLFHMPRENNRKSMGMSMLFLRTAHLEKRKTWWFVINRVPVRYSMWEHGPISGLDCKEYPPNYLDLGSTKFVNKWFKREEKILVSEVEAKLKSMAAGQDRLKIAVIYFLASIMIAKNKVTSVIDPFILRIIYNLDVCKMFPWGRYSFAVCSEGMETILNNLGSALKGSVKYGGCIIPLELLAFEAIPSLRMEYRRDGLSRKDCPKMFKRKFKQYSMKG